MKTCGTDRMKQRKGKRMKRTKRAAALLLALLMMLSLCACGGSAPAATAAPAPTEAPTPAETENPLAPYAGEYKEYSVVLDGTHLILDKYENFSVTLNADGTGYLDWGTDNQGPISAWNLEGEKVNIKAGASEITGSLKDGVLLLGDDYILCFVKPGANTSSMPRLTPEEYKAQQAAPVEAVAEAEAKPAELEAKPVEGEYTFVAATYQGQTVTAEEAGVDYKIKLDADGTSILDLDEAVYDIVSWTQEGSNLTFNLSDGSLYATIDKGFLALDFYGDSSMFYYYAREGTDASAIEEFVADIAAPPSSMLYSYCNGIDSQAGLHLSYEVDTGYRDAHQIVETHTKDGVYYELTTTQVSGYESSKVTFFRDGTAYTLYPEDMTGSVATTMDSATITSRIRLLDNLWKAIETNAVRKDFTTETREIDGVAYTAEIFPAGDYTAEAVFCFDANGQLVYYIEGAPVIDTGLEIGESVYKVHAVDTAVNEALFDISAYTIS